MDIKNEIFNISNQISDFINSWLEDKKDFECRTFYGETYTLALMRMLGVLKPEIKEKIINSYEKIDKLDSQFHWEFNNYALLQYYSFSGDKDILKYIYPLKFKHTPCTNWTLLRSVARLIAKQDEELALREARDKINKFQLSSGMILDEKNVKSFQYHCFSMAMIAEIYEATDKEEFKKSFLLGVSFIRNFILSTGDTIYIGRGQRQSFGYGALIYILAMAYKYTRDASILGDLSRVVEFLKIHQNSDGSFPLVLNGNQQKIPTTVDIKDPDYAGWYPYNNYFDYLPFMGFFIAKANIVLNELDVAQPIFNTPKNYSDNNYIKKVTNKYEAVISRVGGYWTNDMPIPYIVSKDKSITPCYGGEQFQKSLYSLKGIPLPYSKLLNKSARWKGLSFLKNQTLWVISPLGIVRRKFSFLDDYIRIETSTFSLLKFVNLYLFKADSTRLDGRNNLVLHDVEVTCTGLKEVDKYEYSPDGKLILLEDESKMSIIEFKFY
ncbi:hypothetical protein [Paenibacillus prosopidis]|uniref:Heparinase II/III-like protein n=1 Tax=Paenibacillus prosopidis TaxID=630520 RepID=A0A368W236_9BACL|nr:hypothetical protein [Paenibacillus prosopidis]RCW47885.1 hypothetical protein DFP97_10785 [Paenibacillus prosopidis]